MNAAKLAEGAPLFAALGDKTRLTIVARLCNEGPLSVVRLCEGSAISRQAISKHLGALSKAGFVRSELSGRERIYSLERKRIAEVQRHLDRISQQWDAAIERLRAFTED